MPHVLQKPLWLIFAALTGTVWPGRKPFMSGNDSQTIAVLLVDDQALVAEAIRRALSADAGLALHYCATPDQALEMAGQIKPMVILQDLVMPGVDGLDLVRQYRESPVSRDIPIIVLSTKEEPATKKEAFARGANDYLIKIPDQLELIARLRYHATAYLNLCQRNAAYAAQQASELRLRQIIMHNADGVLVVDPQGMIRFANPAAEKIFRKSGDELVGTSFGQQLAADQTTEVSIPGTDSTTTAEVRSVNTEWEGEPASLVSLRDITERKRAEAERKRMEQQIQQGQKLESIGQLAAGIAHEINTPAQYLLSNGRFLQEACADMLAVFDQSQQLLPDIKAGTVSAEKIAQLEARMQQADFAYLAKDVPSAIEQSLSGVEHIAKIVQAMKEFSQPSTAEKLHVNLNKALETTLTVSHHQWASVADVTTQLSPDLPTVPCLPGEINQVFLSVIVNAAQAIADKLKGSNGKGQIVVSSALLPGQVEIRISDTGCGIPEHIRERVFDPFVTTREVGSGTGQGLTIARSIVVDKHGGGICFETQTGGGTTFIVTLPLN
jgi:signal transduction histidine kinase/CheY-like chemotaxis protein